MEQAKSINLRVKTSLNNDFTDNNFSQAIFDENNIELNQKLNAFFHGQLKVLVGIRKYLYNLQNIVFTAINKQILAVIGCNCDAIGNVYDKFNAEICKIVKDTWKNSAVKIKYFYIKDGKLREVNFESDFIEKPVSKVVYFNETTTKQTFENFVSSEENLTALEVSQSMACYIEKELVSGGSIVFLYGDESVGKTHLANAVVGFYKEKGGKACYMTATNFLRQYVSAVQQQNVFSFQDNILSNEIIVIDDIDDLIGKNGTLLAFQKLIAVAIEKGKYVLLTSKISPNTLCEKNTSIKSILSNAVSIKLKPQQNALKTSILMNYICEHNMNVPISIVRDLVVNLNCNVRELKNYIKKLAIVQSIHKFELNTNLALEILSDEAQQKELKRVISNDDIAEAVASYYKISVVELKSKIKCANVCRARSIAMYLMRRNSANFQEIGAVLNRNHSTIIAGIKNVEKWLNIDKKLPSELADIQKTLS